MSNRSGRPARSVLLARLVAQHRVPRELVSDATIVTVEPFWQTLTVRPQLRPIRSFTRATFHRTTPVHSSEKRPVSARRFCYHEFADLASALFTPIHCRSPPICVRVKNAVRSISFNRSPNWD
ncbi:hypothetical protein CEE69_00405 [Rhodopirellula bahusiensis]|uniref:Uncharacterized protein n=1 Tax=Rhodopirellula bahusiensis TaxID=2014065 RepID=A0A2G1WE78_9BACT|nr:hypothetical protein CEE69_00405 [Rhodopirellula bahusiensis]